jgi:hypothetical protein
MSGLLHKDLFEGANNCEESELSSKFSEFEHVKIKWDRLHKIIAHL